MLPALRRAASTPLGDPSRMNTPITSYPSRSSSAAATELSTPPLIATTTFFRGAFTAVNLEARAAGGTMRENGADCAAKMKSMTQDHWTAVDRYFADLLLPPDPALDAALRCERGRRAAVDPRLGGPGQAAPPAGAGPGRPPDPRDRHARRLQHDLAGPGARPRRKAGWSRSRPTRGTPRSPAATSPRAGLADVVELRVGRAIETLPQLAAERAGPFDLVFIDADKPATADYFAWALRLTRRGSLIVVDNVVRKGEVVEADSDDANVQGIRRFNEARPREPRVSATAIQTVGSKGYDGFALALVTG